MSCKRAPTGWACSRSEGHEGPCVAYAVDPQREAEPASRTLVKVTRAALLSAKSHVERIEARGRDEEKNLRAALRGMLEALEMLERRLTALEDR